MENQLTVIEEKIKVLFKETTPKECIKFRKGAGNKPFPYVPIDYTLGKLDATFGIFWEFKIVEKTIGKKQVIVQGELIIKSPSGFSVSRPGIGRKNIVFYSGTENPVDIGNDVKAAVSDAIKKGASMFGIAADVYYKELERYEDIQEDIDQSKEERQQSYARFFAVASERGFDAEAARTRIKEVFKVDHMDKLNVAQIMQATKSLEKYYEKVTQGESPRKIGEVSKVSRPAASQQPVIDAEIRGDESKQVSEVSAAPKESIPEDMAVDTEKEPDGKPVPYFCQGKKHDPKARPQTTVDEPWCSKECEDSYYDSINKTGNRKFQTFMEDQRKKKEAVVAIT